MDGVQFKCTLYLEHKEYSSIVIILLRSHQAGYSAREFGSYNDLCALESHQTPLIKTLVFPCSLLDYCCGLIMHYVRPKLTCKHTKVT